jgi:membrane protein YqaA with SNARE-associated domain
MLFAVLAFLWGFAEATLFFIVPDVLLTYLVVLNLNLALWGCLFALSGALVGGAVMYYWGRKNLRQAEHLVGSMPGIWPKLLEREKIHLQEKKELAILIGPLKGVPYKIYAIFAAKSRVSFVRFFLISIPARLIRFVLASLLAAVCLAPISNLTVQLSLLSGFWVVFYIWYFKKMGNLFH